MMFITKLYFLDLFDDHLDIISITSLTFHRMSQQRLILINFLIIVNALIRLFTNSLCSMYDGKKIYTAKH